MSCFKTGGPGRNSEPRSHHQPPEELRKGQHVTPHIQPPPRVLLSGIHLSWAVCAPPGRTLSQNDYPRTTQKLTPSPYSPRLRAKQQSSPPGFPYPTALRPGTPSQWKSFSVSICVSDNSFPSVRQETTSGPWKGSPFLQQFHGQRSLVGYSPRGSKALDTIEGLSTQIYITYYRYF